MVAGILNKKRRIQYIQYLLVYDFSNRMLFTHFLTMQNLGALFSNMYKHPENLLRAQYCKLKVLIFMY